MYLERDHGVIKWKEPKIRIDDLCILFYDSFIMIEYFNGIYCEEHPTKYVQPILLSQFKTELENMNVKHLYTDDAIFLEPLKSQVTIRKPDEKPLSDPFIKTVSGYQIELNGQHLMEKKTHIFSDNLIHFLQN